LYIETWANRLENTVTFGQGFMYAPWEHYLAWFNHEGMCTVYWRGSTARNAYNPLAPQGHGIQRTFTMQGEVVQQMIKLIFKNLVKSNRVLTHFNFQVLHNINFAR
jgi:hypothetical protein